MVVPESEVVLRRGSTVRVRPAHDGDQQAIVDFYLGLSDRSRWTRFMSAWTGYDRFAEQVTTPHGAERMDLLALAGPKVIAHAMYVTTEAGRAEVAFAVDDRYHGQGLATLMLGQLADAASSAGIDTFEAITLPENSSMLGVFRASGFDSAERFDPDGVEVRFPTELTPQARERFDQRDRLAAAAAVRAIVAPRSIAVIGASRDPSSIGAAVLHNIVEGGYQGSLYPVNPQADTLEGIACYRNVDAIGEDIDLGIIVVPAPAVVEVARRCGVKGARSLLVISAGFSETGPEGQRRQQELLDVCAAYGMRLVGPNCFGIINTDPDVRMNATFARSMPPPGPLGFLTQSGALGLSVIDHVRELGLGMSTFVSNGNKADISGNDLLSYWESDPRTEVVMLYLESFGNPRRFARIARQVGRAKPILVVKSGRSKAGARATGSHTGALLAASDLTVDALFQQSGVVRCDTINELFGTAMLMSKQPLPSGGRVAIVTNAGGLGILCADACEAEGLDVVEFDEELKATLRDFLQAGASATNPVDMIASATPDDYRRVIDAVASSGTADAIIAIYIPPRVTDPDAIARAIVDASTAIGASDAPLPVLAVFMSDPETTGRLREHVPTYAYPEEAARALGHAVRYARWRAQPHVERGRLADADERRAKDRIAAELDRGTGWLPNDAIAELLDAYGIPRVAEVAAHSPDEAVERADALGYPVALKAVAPGLLHKTEHGAVATFLADAEEVRRSAERMSSHLVEAGFDVHGFVVQQMVPTGVEMLVGVATDPSFGPVVAVGAGGTTAEILGDIQVRLTPLHENDPIEMIRALRTSRLLDGYRGTPAVDVDSLVDVIHRIGAMVEAHPEIVELDCNPVVVTPQGAVVVDARVRIGEPAARPLLGARRTA